MTAEILRSKTKDEVLNFIRERLSFDENVSSHLRYTDREVFKKEHYRFEMSGYESKTGQSTVINISLLNKFADLGIYDFTSYLFLNFYKGTPTIYLKYFTKGTQACNTVYLHVKRRQ